LLAVASVSYRHFQDGARNWYVEVPLQVLAQDQRLSRIVGRGRGTRAGLQGQGAGACDARWDAGPRHLGLITNPNAVVQIIGDAVNAAS
jgi:hypothetical protein